MSSTDIAYAWAGAQANNAIEARKALFTADSLASRQQPAASLSCTVVVMNV